MEAATLKTITPNTPKEGAMYLETDGKYVIEGWHFLLGEWRRDPRIVDQFFSGPLTVIR